MYLKLINNWRFSGYTIRWSQAVSVMIRNWVSTMPLLIHWKVIYLSSCLRLNLQTEGVCHWYFLWPNFVVIRVTRFETGFLAKLMKWFFLDSVCILAYSFWYYTLWLISLSIGNWPSFKATSCTSLETWFSPSMWIQICMMKQTQLEAVFGK
jgi:hypothetical protein